jgi:PD-(D/E)XK nuclease superfamily
MELNPTFPRLVDSTMLSSYLACPRQFYWAWINRLTVSQKSIHLHAGAAFAAALESFRLSFYGSRNDYDTAMRDAVERFIKEWGDFPLMGDENKSFYNMLGALDSYFTTYPPATDHVQPYMVNGKPAVEFSFAIPTSILHPETGEPILYAGRCDMIGSLGETLLVIDEKTTSQLGNSWSKKWSLRGQFIGYTMATRRLGNLPVAGAMIRGVSILKGPYGHAEVLVYFPEWQIERWWIHVERTIQRMVHDYSNTFINSNSFDQNFSDACAAYSSCQFLNLCMVQEPSNWIDGFYIRNEWNPLARNPEEPKP